MRFLSFLILSLAVLMLFSCFVMPAEVVDEDQFLSKTSWKSQNTRPEYQSIDSDSGRLPLLFQGERKDLSCIILLDLKDSEIYKTIEYQAVHDERGDGHIVILYDLDECKNIYYSTGLIVDKKDYSQFDDVKLISKAEIEGRYYYSSEGMTASMEMKDVEGRKISYSFKEKEARTELEGLVAPVAQDVENPEYFPFIYMDYFGFSPVSKTMVNVEIDGQDQNVQSLPFKLNGIKPYMIRYSLSSPVINWNSEVSGSLESLELLKGIDPKNVQGWDYKINWNGNIPEIDSIISSGAAGEITVRFSPAIPNIFYLGKSHEIHGRFSFSSERHKGIFAGEYSLVYSEGWIFSLTPTHCSKPVILPGQWWKEFHYQAYISEDESEIESSWSKF